MSAPIMAEDVLVPAAMKKPAKAKSKGGFNKKTPGSWLILLFLVAATLAWVGPMYLAFVNAFKQKSEYVTAGPLALPTQFTFDNIVNFWVTSNYGEKLWNSIQISFFVAVIGVALSFFTAYAIGIGRIKGRYWVLGLFMIAFTIPGEALMYPLLRMMKDINLYDTIWSLVIIFAVLQSVFGTYLLSSVLSEFPEEIVEAARIDGAGSWTLMRHIVFPLTRPTMMVLMVFFFIWTWNEFLLPLVMLPSNRNQTVSVALAAANGQYGSDPTAQAAAALMGLIPTLLFFLIFQRTLLKGVTMGSVK